MLIVEGADCLGKTTLCKKLIAMLHARGCPATYQHLSRLPASWKFPGDYRQMIRPWAVQDRFHMSEVAYALARGDEPLISPTDYQIVDAWTRCVGSCTVVVAANARHLNELFEKHKHADEMYNLSVVARANEHYWAMSDGGIGDYVPDVAFRVKINDADCRWPAERDYELADIVDEYVKRVHRIAQIASQVEASLRAGT